MGTFRAQSALQERLTKDECGTRLNPILIGFLIVFERLVE